MLLTSPSPCHKLSHFLGNPSPLERDVLYGRLLSEWISQHRTRIDSIWASPTSITDRPLSLVLVRCRIVAYTSFLSISFLRVSPAHRNLKSQLMYNKVKPTPFRCGHGGVVGRDGGGRRPLTFYEMIHYGSFYWCFVYWGGGRLPTSFFRTTPLGMGIYTHRHSTNSAV